MNWKGLLMRASAVAGLVLGLPLLVLSQETCGPVITNPPPVESPAILVTKYSQAGWTATAYVETCYVAVANVGDVTLTSISIPDSARIAAYIPLPASSAVTEGPTLVANSGNDSLILNGSWTGLAHATNGNLLTLAAPDTLAPATQIVIRYIITVTHNGIAPPAGTYTNRAWGSGISPAATTVTDSDFIQLMVPAAPQTPCIGLGLKIGTATGTSGSFAVPCTLKVKNVGNVAIGNFVVQDSLAGAFTNINGASLTSITATGATAPFTFKASYDGGRDAANNDTLLADAVNTLAVGDSLRLTFTANFDEGDGTTFQTQAKGEATGPAPNSLATQDFSDMMSSYASGNVNPSGTNCASDPGEDDQTTWTVPISGTATTTVVMSAAGNWVGYVPFASGAMPVTQFYGGNGILMQDTLAATFSTQYDSLVCWPTTPRSIRLARLAFKPTHVGTYTVTLPGSPQSADSVNTETAPGFEVLLNGTTYTFTRADFGTVPAGRIYRTATAVKEHSHGDGRDVYGNNPGTTAVMMEYRWYKDGTYRALVGIRNRRAFEGNKPTQCADQTQIKELGQYDPTDGCTGVVSPSQVLADWSIVRRSGRVMKLRWAADYGLATGDQASIHLWHADSYDHAGGEEYDDGGKLRAGEDLWVEVTDQTEDPPEGWYTNEYYKLTAAIHDTDNLVIMEGDAYNSADSLKFRWETNARAWIDGVDAENPVEPDWVNIRDFGGRYRAFDGGTGGLNSNEGNDQYREDHNTLKLCLSMARSTSDTLLARPTLLTKAWKLFESGSRKHAHGCYNLRYNFAAGLDCQFAWGIMWPHTKHGANDQDYRGRSSEPPASNYTLQGDGVLDVWHLTGWNAYKENYDRLVQNRRYHATSTQWRNGLVTGGQEARKVAGVMMWLAMHYDMTDSTLYRDLAVNLVRDRFANEDLSTTRCPPSGNLEKPWMWGLFATEVRQLARILERRSGDAALASEMRGLVAAWQVHFDENGWFDDNPEWRGANYPTCTAPGPATAFKFAYYHWGQTGAPNVCAEERSFWAAMHGSVMADYGGDTTLWRDLWRSGVAYVGEGNYECPGNYDGGGAYQKYGITSHWSWDALRQYEGTLDLRPSGDGPDVSEDFFD